MTITSQHSSTLEHRFLPTKAGARASVSLPVYLLLAVASYIAYYRSTAMGYGYPAYQDQLGEADYGTLQLLNYCLAALGSIYILIDGPFLLRTVRRAPALTFGVLLIVITVLEADDPVFAARMFLTVFFVSLPVVAFAARFGIKRTLENFRRFCIAAILVNIVYTAAFPHFAIMGGGAGFRGMFPHKNQLGPFMAIAFVALFPSGKRSALDNLFATGACAVALLFVIFSRSASAWVMLMVAPLLYLGLRFVLLGSNRIIRSIVVVGFAASAATAVVLGYLYFFDTVLNMLGRDPTLTGRTTMWAFLLNDAWERPFLGHGFGAYSQPAAFAKYWIDFGWSAVSTHNSYLEGFLNLGLIVLGYWGFLLLKVARANLVRDRDLPPTDVIKQQIMTIMILVSAFSQANHFFAGTFFWLVLIISLFHDKYGGRGVKRLRKSRLLRALGHDVVRPSAPPLAPQSR